MTRLAALLLTLLLPLSALAADGDAWPAYTDTRSGQYDVRGFLICDGKLAADSTCAEFDLSTVSGGWPLFYNVFIILIDPECSGTPDFQVRGTHTVAGVKTDLGVSMSEAGTNSQDFEVTHRYVDVNLTDDAACDAPGNDVALVLYYERTP